MLSECLINRNKELKNAKKVTCEINIMMNDKDDLLCMEHHFVRAVDMAFFHPYGTSGRCHANPPQSNALLPPLVAPRDAKQLLAAHPPISLYYLSVRILLTGHVMT